MFISDEINLFVPGRLCLFGEHSDWAGEYSKRDSSIEMGFTIVCPTNQGTYAKARKLGERKFVMRSTLSDKILETNMQKDSLERIAEDSKNRFSYVAGVASCILETFDNGHISGVEINNYETTLPVKKGLSSSASVCVLTARAFNKLYDLKLTREGEMEFAYKGERKTRAGCGKMDQACAFDSPVLMTFDGDFMRLEELKVGKDIYFTIVDLNKGKNTLKILNDLNMHFFHPDSQKEVRNYLGVVNKEIVLSAIDTLKQGDAKKVGELMTLAQKLFDKHLTKYCDELKAPRLHEVLNYASIQDLIYGGKGVGSQGDGSAQFVCRGIEERKRATEILERDLGVKCYELDLKKS